MRKQPPREYTIVDMARAFCIAGHTGVEQKRKYTGEDYHHHPEEALQILLTYCEPTWEQQAAILLHDLIEDTGVKRKNIAQVFGQEVSRLVWGVTDVSVSTDGNRAFRKKLDRDHILSGCDRILELKLSDLISNARSITMHDKKFAKVFLIEMLQYLQGMRDRMANTAIYEEAYNVTTVALKAVHDCPKDLFYIWALNYSRMDTYDEFMQIIYPEVENVEIQSNDSSTPKSD